MSEIMMIPVEALEHHPDNPRKELGDLKELIASIKQSGVMQNLTVVPNPNDDETWWVVIGNRRMEASKAAGLKELPCIISDMDHKTQVATMMAENMQRVDLTLMEQAGGIQMMLDLGMTDADISKSTGLRKDAIARRRTVLKYDAAKAEAGFRRGATLQDFAKLEQVEDEKARERLLDSIGTPNYNSEVTNMCAARRRNAAGKRSSTSCRHGRPASSAPIM